MEREGGSNVCVVPPGFRFHPTDEELLYYYLRKKISYESIDLDVIREVDLNKLEPWDLKEKCRIGSGPQNEWYFFSHKDKKYPTGSRTNRATAAGFWKATGRDKAIHLNNKRIGMRKTLVFYTGRAPHGQKTDWIMHEYRLQLDNHVQQSCHNNINNALDVQEDGWVVCRVFKKKVVHSNRTFDSYEDIITVHHHPEEEHVPQYNNIATTSTDGNQIMMMKAGAASGTMEKKQKMLYGCCAVFDGSSGSTNSNCSMHHHHHQYLPQLLSGGGSPDHRSAETACNVPPPSHIYQPLLSHTLMNINTDTIQVSQNLLNITSTSSSSSDGAVLQQQHERFATDWSFLDKLLASSHGHHQQNLGQPHKSHVIINPSPPVAAAAAQNDHGHHLLLDLSSSHHRFPFQYMGYHDPTDLSKFPDN